MTWEVGDIVRLTGVEWEGRRTPQVGDLVEIDHVLSATGEYRFTDAEGVHWYVYDTDYEYDETYHDWGAELASTDREVGEMTRLPRERKGKTPIDVGIVKQDGLTRVRISMGEDLKPGRKNSDLSVQETEDLIAMLNYNMLVAKGEIDE